MRLFLLSLLCLVVNGCSHAEEAQPKAEATVTPIPHTHASAAQLLKMRDQWNVANQLILVSGDTLRGQIAQLLDAPDESRDYPIVQASPNGDDAARALPRTWETTGSLIVRAGQTVDKTYDDFMRWKNGDDLDDPLRQTLKDDAQAIVSTMCDALQDARGYYAAAGGYRDDISFVMLSDKGDQSCMDAPMAHPYRTTIQHPGLATIAAANNETPVTSADEEQPYLEDHTGFIEAVGTPVTVLAHRHYDGGDITVCKVHGGGGTGWIPCAWLVRKPSPVDG